MLTSNRISGQLAEYLKYKRSLGYLLASEESALNNFVRHSLRIGYEGPLTKDLALGWICSENAKTNKSRGRRLEVLVPFTKFVASFDNEAEMLPSRMFGNPHTRTVPYIYTEQEALQLMDKCRGLQTTDGLRPLAVATALGLLWSTGLRTSELTNLRIRDVDLHENLLYIWSSKFKKDRIVPLSESASAKLSQYKATIDGRFGARHGEAPFFVTDGGRPLTPRSLMYAFQLVRGCIGARPMGHPAVRLTDFRHSFACRTVAAWLGRGEDVNARILQLSTYLGHAKVQDTYWYLSATPQMLALSSSLYESGFGGGCDG